ncbi:MAG: hypothetical protein ABI408_02225 [Gemmatimonadaceae bacterium]
MITLQVVLVAKSLPPYAVKPPFWTVIVELQPRETRDLRVPHAKSWQPVRPEESTRLSDPRQQFHHAAQFAAAAGLSFLERLPDDSQATLEWIPSLAGLFSQVIPAATFFRIGVTPTDLSVLIVTENDQPFARYKLHGHNIVDATDWIRAQVTSLGADSSRYTLKRPYEIPNHAVEMGDDFDSSDKAHFDELSRWFSNGAATIASFARTMREASEVKCWPEHFDIATLIQATSDRTIGVGLEPGDNYYDEPYFYINMNPQPAALQARSRPLWGRGTWHTEGWVGAVLPGSRLGAASAQLEQVREFIDSAVSACRGLATEN